MIEPYFSIVARIITPNKFSPPSPMTSALSAELVLLQVPTMESSNGLQKNVRYQALNATETYLNCHFFSSKNFSTLPLQSAHRFPTYSFLPVLMEEAVRCSEGNLYKIFPCNRTDKLPENWYHIMTYY